MFGFCLVWLGGLLMIDSVGLNWGNILLNTILLLDKIVKIWDPISWFFTTGCNLGPPCFEPCSKTTWRRPRQRKLKSRLALSSLTVFYASVLIIKESWEIVGQLYYIDVDADAEPDPMRLSLKKEKIGKVYVENIRLFVLMWLTFSVIFVS